MITRGKPPCSICQYIRKMVLRQDFLPCLQPWLNSRVICNAQGLKSSLHAQPQNFDSFSHMYVGINGQKRTKCDQFFHPIQILSFLQPYFFYHTLTDGVGLVDRAFRNLWPQFVYMSVPLAWKINIYRSTGDQFSNNKLATLVPSVLVYFYISVHIVF